MKTIVGTKNCSSHNFFLERERKARAIVVRRKREKAYTRLNNWDEERERERLLFIEI